MHLGNETGGLMWLQSQPRLQSVTLFQKKERGSYGMQHIVIALLVFGTMPALRNVWPGLGCTVVMVCV